MKQARLNLTKLVNQLVYIYYLYIYVYINTYIFILYILCIYKYILFIYLYYYTYLYYIPIPRYQPVVSGFQPLVVGTTLGLGITLLPLLHCTVRLSTSKKNKQTQLFLHSFSAATSLSLSLVSSIPITP
jgi:hypothetical protein